MGPPFSSQPEPGSGRKAGSRWGGVGEGGGVKTYSKTPSSTSPARLSETVSSGSIFSVRGRYLAIPSSAETAPRLTSPYQRRSSRSYLALTQSYRYRGRSDPAWNFE